MSKRSDQTKRVIELAKRSTPQLLESKLSEVLAKSAPAQVASGSIDKPYGRIMHPYDYKVIEAMREYNVAHASCLTSKVGCTTGLGHRDEGIYEVLDPLCNFSWQSVLDSACDDYFEKGVAFIEVVRNGPNGEITGLHHLPVRNTYVYWEGSNQWHYEVDSPAGTSRPGTVKLARFGDLETIRERFAANSVPGAETIQNSEVIHINATGSRNSWYGAIDWLSAVPTMELAQVTLQEEFDYHWNRSVPDFLLFLLGGVSDDVMDEIEASLAGTIGPGNTRKSLIANLQGAHKDTHEVVFHQLGSRGQTDSTYSDDDVAQSLKVVSAHGVPALLAGIQVPGKMGATNELPNALQSFQLLRIAPAQKLWSRALANTLGHPESGLPLTPDQFLKGEEAPKQFDMPAEAMAMRKPRNDNGFISIVDELDLNQMDTVSRMRQPLAGSGRDPKDGLLERGGDRKPAQK